MPLPLSYYKKIKVGANTPADFARTGCLEPKTLWITDAETGQQRRIYVDCGHCFNCLNQRRKEWVTRMIHHSHYYLHCYFVTLTYGSYNLSGFEQHPFKDDWLMTYPVLDTHNSSGRPRWTPSILRHEHLTKFFKRLRKFHDSAPISYVGCGELGDRFGRPHFHVLLWSDLVLTAQDIADAWGYKCVKLDHNKIVVDNGKYDDRYQHFNFRIGRIDMVDLVANGSLDPHKCAKDVQDHHTAKYCFSYVAKYIGKQNALTMFDHDGKSCTNQYAYERYKKAFELYPQSLSADFWDPHVEWCEYKDAEGRFQVHYDYKLLSTLKDYILNDKAVPALSTKSIDFNYNGIDYENVDFYKFATIAGPFFVCSRGYAIGKQYALENLHRFKKGDYNIPEFQSKSLTFPSYYVQMAERSLVPIRFEKVSICGKLDNVVKGQDSSSRSKGSKVESVSLNKGSYPRVYEFFTKLREDRSIPLALGSFNIYSCPFLDATRVEDGVNIHAYESPLYFSSEIWKSMSPEERAARRKKYEEVQHLGTIDGKSLIPGSYLDIACTIPEIGLVHYRYNFYNDSFDGFRFIPSGRKYEHYDTIDRIDFCDWVIECINKKWATLPNRQDVQQQKLELMDMIEADPRTWIERDKYMVERGLDQKYYTTNHFDPM